jgi:hypothetical protein
MSYKSSGDDQFITIIPYCPERPDRFREKIVIRKLNFACNDVYAHPVNDESIRKFLLHIKLFGASFYPDFPEFGCYAINADEVFTPGDKCGVSEIHYKGEVIFCRS